MNPHAAALLTFLSAAGISVTGCTVDPGQVAARVDCGTPGPHGVDCTISRTGGAAAFQACWDLVITCRNQAVMSGSACHDMPAGRELDTGNMPVAAFSGQDACDTPASGQVERLRLEEK